METYSPPSQTSGGSLKRPPFVLAYLLSLLALLMGVHLMLLMARDRECSQYEQLLLDRLRKAPIASTQSRDVRSEIQNLLGGRYSDCSESAIRFSDASDKYLSVILALLRGAGVSAGIGHSGRQHGPTDQLVDDAERKDGDQA